MKNSVILLAIAIIAFACAPLKKYKPDNSVSDNLFGRGVSTSDSTMATLKWTDVFTDENLQNIINISLEKNLDLKIAYEHIKQAEAQLLGAKLAYVPSLSLNPTGSYSSFTDMKGMGWGYNIGAQLSWEVDIFGKMANRKKAALTSVNQMRDEQQAVRVALISSVASSYYTLAMLDSQLETSVDMLKVWKASVDAIHDLKREGFADEVAVSQYEATYANLQAISSGLREKIEITENALSLLLSEPCTSFPRTKLWELGEPKVFPVGVPIQMLTYRPDVRAAQRQVEIAYYMTRDAWLNFFPSLNLAGSVGLTNNLSGIIYPLSFLSSLTAGLVAPILTSGVNKANLRNMQSQQEEAKYNLDKALLIAGKEVNDALVAINGSNEKQGYYESQVTSLTKARDDTELLMKNSETKTYLDVLAAHNALIEARFNFISNRANGLIGVVDLYAALGGGSEF